MTDSVSQPCADQSGSGGHWLDGVMEKFLAKFSAGSLRLALPGGGQFHSVARGHRELAADMRIERWRAMARINWGGDLGFADSYIDGDWNSHDLPSLIEFAARNRQALGGMMDPPLAARLMARLMHRLRDNSRAGSRRNIVAHYDLGNDFYRRWLDEGMSYSSALYQHDDQSLEDAQIAKQARAIELIDGQRGARVLEIGCGWGGLCECMAALDWRVTGVTLSPSQLAYAEKRRFRRPVDLRLQDYRDIGETYDRIVSIEMLEAVGESFWPVYFARLKQLLAPRGRVVLQAITVRDDAFDRYRGQVDFIQRSVFPGGCLPSAGIIERHLKDAGLVLRSVEHFGDSYARTLADWRRRFLAAWPEIEQMGFPPRFKRLWDYYLAYCEGGFRAGDVDVGFYCAEHE